MRISTDARTGRFLTTPQTVQLSHDLFASEERPATWLAGLIAADGCISADRKRLALTQSGDHGRLIIEEARKLTNHKLKISRGTPRRGQPTYAITLNSPQMIADLDAIFGITPRKTLVYKFPDIPPHMVASFLRGYVDGDGCVGIYRTPQGNAMLHLSFVGTPQFIRSAISHIPAAGRFHEITRCAALAEARYSGRHAWAACGWLFSDADLLRTAKAQIFEEYRKVLSVKPPIWFTQSQQRQIAMARLAAGGTVAAAADAAGVRCATVYGWRKSQRI
ncbi:hypothetical protein AB0F72_14585 [Actinoplanes sp. NPDC023936]|uniref:hypothetical protein n=1 Tax=Actinoplanes sp. NPDC023936 TaxID=3154910 RepID=UPI0033F986A2